MINHLNSKYIWCPVFSGTVKKGIFQVILPNPHSVLQKHHSEFPFQNISILHNDSNDSNLVWFRMYRHLSCLMRKLLMRMKSPLLYHIQLWHFFKRLSLSKFIIYFPFPLCGIFHSWSLLKIRLRTIFNNFKYYNVTCNLITSCEEMS